MDQYPELIPPDIDLENQNYDAQYYKKREFCSKNSNLLGSLKGFQCNRYNHNKVIYEKKNIPQLLNAEMIGKSGNNKESNNKESNNKESDNKESENGGEKGLYMFHFLFRCFHDTKKLLTRFKKYGPEKRENMIITDLNVIESLRTQISEKEREIAFLTKYDMLIDDLKTCPFHRKKPETYVE